jgi:hypothetical protein
MRRVSATEIKYKKLIKFIRAGTAIKLEGKLLVPA